MNRLNVYHLTYVNNHILVAIFFKTYNVHLAVHVDNFDIINKSLKPRISRVTIPI